MEIAFIILICAFAVDFLIDAFVRAGGTGEMLVTALMFCLKWFGYLMLFGLCLLIVIWLADMLYRLYKRFKRWRHSRRAMRENCCELEEEEEDWDCWGFFR